MYIKGAFLRVPVSCFFKLLNANYDSWPFQRIQFSKQKIMDIKYKLPLSFTLVLLYSSARASILPWHHSEPSSKN